LADTYGSSDKRNKIINEIFKSAKYNKNIKLNFPNQEINYTHIDDVVNAIIFLIKKNKKKRWLNYNLYSKETLTLINLAKKIESTINKKIIVYSNSKYKLKNKKFKFKTRYKNIPGWKQKISLLKGLKKYFNNYKNDPKN
jgi:nucleoside-diphosphate-sugar epimerase